MEQDYQKWRENDERRMPLINRFSRAFEAWMRLDPPIDERFAVLKRAGECSENDLRTLVRILENREMSNHDKYY